MSALTYVLAAAWAVWLGTVVFFSFVVAPTVHGVLDKQHAGALMRRMFPRYYLAGAISGAAALLAALATESGLRVTAPLLAGIVLTVYARQVLSPALDTARAAVDTERFAELHVLSVRLNLVVLAMLLLVGTVVVAP